MGTLDAPATCAAVTDATEHPAPMIALTPCPLNAVRVRCSAPINAAVESHLESLCARRSCVRGSK
eukprot:2261888-Prymnesium_polylepis.1